MGTAVDVVVSLAGLGLILTAAERLVHAAVGVALAFRLAPFIVAVVFIGFDPENLFVGAAASRADSAGIALGAIIGAAMVAIALAFGITALLCPMRFDAAPAAVLAVPAGAAALFALLTIDGTLGRVDGAILLAAYAAAVVVLVRLERRGVTITGEGESAEALEHPPSPARAAVMLLVTLGLLVAGSELLVEAARDLIDAAGWSEIVVGMSLVALAVSVEELARELPAAARGHAEMAVGNVAGSILAFFLFNAGIIALVQPVAVPDSVTIAQLPIALAAVATVTFLLARRAVTRIGGGALVALYAAFLVSLLA